MMKRILMIIVSLTISLLLFSSLANAQTERLLKRATLNNSGRAAISHGVSHHSKPLAQCPFNMQVVSIPPGPPTNGFQWSDVIVPLKDPCVTGIEVDPTDEKTWYVSGPKGLYVTRDGGVSWTYPLKGPIYDQAVVISPQNPNEIYVGIGQTLFHSSNKGTSWGSVHKFEGVISSLYIGPGSAIYVGGSDKPNGLYVSQNKGMTWYVSPFGDKQSLVYWDIERDPINGTLYVSTEIANHPQPYHPPFFRLPNGGSTWMNVSGTLPWHVIAIQIRPTDGYIYALTEGAGMYGSPNHGANWIQLTKTESPSDSLLMDKKFPKRLFGGRQSVGGGGAFVSVDGGKTFQKIGLKNVTIGGMSLNGDSTRLYAAAYASGIYISTVPPMLIPPN